jgi:hypothetical protein
MPVWVIGGVIKIAHNMALKISHIYYFPYAWFKVSGVRNDERGAGT